MKKQKAIKFDRFFNFTKGKAKVKFNMNAGDENKKAFDLLCNNYEEWIRMNSWKSKQANNNYVDAEYVLSFAQYYLYGVEYFVFGGLYKIEKKIPEVFDDVGYDLTLQEDYEEYIGRLIIKLKKPIGRDIYNKPYENVQRDFDPEIYEIKSDKKVAEFKGYDKVKLPFWKFKYIFENNDIEWKKALEKVKAVYVITDMETGELYIGSAYGNEGLWERWQKYAQNLTGGNKKLESIKKDKGDEYIINNFQFSIIEIFDTKTNDNYVIEREEFWKQVFNTYDCGLN